MVFWTNKTSKENEDTWINEETGHDSSRHANPIMKITITSYKWRRSARLFFWSPTYKIHYNLLHSQLQELAYDVERNVFKFVVKKHFYFYHE